MSNPSDFEDKIDLFTPEGTEDEGGPEETGNQVVAEEPSEAAKGTKEKASGSDTYHTAESTEDSKGKGKRDRGACTSVNDGDTEDTDLSHREKKFPKHVSRGAANMGSNFCY